MFQTSGFALDVMHDQRWLVQFVGFNAFNYHRGVRAWLMQIYFCTAAIFHAAVQKAPKN